MGLYVSRVWRWYEPILAEPQQPGCSAGPSIARGSRKRKRSSWDIHRSLSQVVNIHQVFGIIYGKKRKLSSKYTYQTLFLGGKDSDIKVRALGRIWSLHKSFLCQSRYFANILKDTWKERHNDIIQLEIKNEDIDLRSLDFVLGSLYRDEDLPLKPLRIPRVLAAACLLEVEDVIRQCNDTMKKTINMKTVCSYYLAAETYRLNSVKTRCLDWILCNLMTHPNVRLYKQIDIKIMYLLVSSSDLLVLPKEINLYTTLKGWVFLYFNPGWKGSVDRLSASANSWLNKHMECIDDITFLESEEGLVFQPVFKQLRFQHIICDLASTTILEQDRLIPLEWLTPVYKQQWLTLLQAQQNRKIGPRTINEKELEGCSMRCGTRISREGTYSWKWSGCRFSFPLHIIFTNRNIIFKQNYQQYDSSTCLKQIQNVVFRITLVCFDADGKVTFSRTTGHKIITFENNQEKSVMELDSNSISFPLYIFFNFLFVSLANTGNL
ncbi:germ cell-less protein-like 2 [Cricetulus griseus]|uniref:Germ cell-less protein-like 1-like protein n=1 Tax=Cricetulus griseus TaxID=10029 RepID=A0A061HWT9_CRIGR|nr:germ cell-less protein-like 2 [Cricetulus griseus]XP_027290068.1 germ cell-less protein-like 2 [Cricetulus griseus]ERE64109.1 germ cell-less protein-like 1-like protein [Cricetulus griseus]